MIELGTGPPLVLIPGIQGRWEWMRPAVEALARRCRVITFSLCGDPGSDATLDPALGFDSFTRQVDAALDRAGVERAAICGVSYGGLIGVHYAAVRPARTRALVLTSTPSPWWQPDRRVRLYVRAPRLCSPLFVATSPGRLLPEIVRAVPAPRACVGFLGRHLWNVAAARMSPVRMSERVRLLAKLDLPADCARIDAPTLVVTGERGLDRVVPVEGSLDYLKAIRNARHVTLERTGHLGVVTRADRFAEIVCSFVHNNGGGGWP
jgi:pimeloyl-ACP methyl ester carboxylesterase